MSLRASRVRSLRKIENLLAFCMARIFPNRISPRMYAHIHNNTSYRNPQISSLFVTSPYHFQAPYSLRPPARSIFIARIIHFSRFPPRRKTTTVVIFRWRIRHRYVISPRIHYRVAEQYTHECITSTHDTLAASLSMDIYAIVIYDIANYFRKRVQKHAAVALNF